MTGELPEPPMCGPRRVRLVKCVVSLWLAYHVAGIVVAAASVPPSSDLVRSSWKLFGPYLQFFNLNNGFHFFGPDPGPSTLVAFTAERADGTSVTGRIPDRAIVPRLLYHRYFMLTEALASMQEANPEVFQFHVRALARQLCRRCGAKAVSLSRLTHNLPGMDWCRALLPLDDPTMYEEHPIGAFQWSDS